MDLFNNKKVAQLEQRNSEIEQQFEQKFNDITAQFEEKLAETRQQAEQQVVEVRQELMTKQEAFSQTQLPTTFSVKNVSVTADTVMQIKTAERCLNLIADTIAQMPVKLYRENADGTIEPVSNDKRLKFFNRKSDKYTSSRNFKKQMIVDYLLNGHAYAYLRKKPAGIYHNEQVFELDELNYMPAKSIKPQFKFVDDITGQPKDVEFHRIHTAGFSKTETKRIFKPEQLLRVVNNPKNAFEGEGILKRGRKILALALAELQYATNLYNNGALPSGVLKSKGKLSQKAIDNLRTSWSNLYSGAENSAKTAILEDDIDYSPLSLNPDQLQMSETRKYINSEICKMFGVPESMITSEANKYDSLGKNNMFFKQYALQPVIDAFEQSFDMQLLTPSEIEAGYFFRFETKELFRTIQLESTQDLIALVKEGVFTSNEARIEFDKAKIAGGDDIRLSLGVVSQDIETGETIVHNMDGGTKQPNNEKGVDVND